MTNRCGQVSIHASRVGLDGERVLCRQGSRRTGRRQGLDGERVLCRQGLDGERFAEGSWRTGPVPTRGRGERVAEGSRRTVRRGVVAGFNSRVPRGARRGERRLHFARAGAGARFRAAGRERINSPFLRSFDPRVRSPVVREFMRKIFFADGATWGKIRKTPIKQGFSVTKKNLRGGVDTGAGIYYIRGKLRRIPRLRQQTALVRIAGRKD